jgi:nucleoid DNA-binding protein
MPPNKTQPSKTSVAEFIASLADANQKKDTLRLIAVMEKITNAPPQLWGTGIIGFGHYHYKYKRGREGDWFLTGFAPRKKMFSLYLMCDIAHKALDFEGLGPHKKGVGCLYIKSLDAVNENVLENLIRKSIVLTQERFGN